MAVTKKNKKRKTKKNTGNRSDSSEYRRLVLTRATESLLGVKVRKIEYPGGKSRESFLMILENEKSVIATRRDKIDRARVEVSTLKALNKHDAPVPVLLANNHSHILIQEEIQGERLSSLLKSADENTYKLLMSATLESLAKIHSAATTESLELLVPNLGDEKGWRAGLVERPAIIGKFLKIKAPELNHSATVDFLRIREPRFIKWDSRPGNAMVDSDGKVLWFDWEHAGNRNRLDDVAWILGDEFLPDYAEVENTLIEHYLPDFADVMTIDEARDYLMAYGTYHIVVRLGLILKHMDGKWWDLDYCIDNDKVGVTLLCAQRLCARGARWSNKCALTQPLSNWFKSVSQHLESL